MSLAALTEANNCSPYLGSVQNKHLLLYCRSGSSDFFKSRVLKYKRGKDVCCQKHSGDPDHELFVSLKGGSHKSEESYLSRGSSLPWHLLVCRVRLGRQ